MRSDESLLKKLDADLSTGVAQPDLTRGVLHTPKEKPLPDDWEPMPTPPPEDPYEKIMKQRKKQQSLFKKFFIASCVFVLLAGGVFAYSLFTGTARLSGENIQLNVLTKTVADSGEEISVRVTVINENPVPMENTRLIFKYPTGNTRNADATRDISRNIGTVNPGEVRDEVFDIALFGEQGVEKPLTAVVEYRLQGSNALFEKITQAPITLRSSVASIIINTQDSLLSGQTIPFRLVVAGNSTSIVRNALLVADYPEGCSFVRSDRNPTLDQNVWYLGDLQPGQQHEFVVDIACSGISESEKTVRFSLGSQSPTNERIIESIYASSLKVVKIGAAFLATSIRINGTPFDSTVSIQQNRDITIAIDWENTTDRVIANAQVMLHLSGDVFDQNRVNPASGFYDSNNRTIIWSANENAAFRAIQPGDKGQLTARVATLGGFSSLATLDLGVSLQGVFAGGVQESIPYAVTAKVPISTDAQFVSEVLHYSGSLQNSGPMPPKVGQETTYTVRWNITNSTNVLNNAVVKTTLPTGINWKGAISPQGENAALQYNSVTREVTWNVGNVSVGQNARTVSFQLGIIPVSGQVGSSPQLTQNTVFTAVDSITRTSVNQTRQPSTTQISVDTTRPGANGRVVQ